MTVTEFLLARIAEDEAEAQAGRHHNGSGVFDRDNYGYLLVQPSRVLAECEAKRAIIEHEAVPELAEWRPDAGGDWTLSGSGYFANYWPDGTVSASLVDENDETLLDSGIIPMGSRVECQAWAERWIRDNWQTPVLRLLTLPYADHPDHDEAWQA